MRKILVNKNKISWLQVSLSSLLQECEKNAVTLIAIEELKIDSAMNDTPDMRDFEGKKIPYPKLLELCRYNICNELDLFRDELDFKDQLQRRVICKWMSYALKAHDYIESVFDSNGIDLVINFHGYLLFDALIRYVAIRRDCPVIGWEVTGHKERLVWDSVSGITINRNMARNIYWRYEGVFSPAIVNDYAEKYINGLSGIKRKEHASAEQEYRSQNGRKLILFLAQVYTDASLLFAPDSIKNPVSLMASLVQYVNLHEDYELFIKIHPKEISGQEPVTAKYYNGISSRKLQEKLKAQKIPFSSSVFIDDKNSYNTYSLIEQSDLVVSINSQAALEATIFGKKVVACSAAFFAGLGFTYDYQGEDDFTGIIETALRDPIRDEKKIKAREFFYCFFEKYCCRRSAEDILKVCFQRRMY